MFLGLEREIPCTFLVHHPCDQREPEQCTSRQPEHDSGNGEHSKTCIKRTIRQTFTKNLSYQVRDYKQQHICLHDSKPFTDRCQILFYYKHKQNQ